MPSARTQATTNSLKTYSEMRRFETFKERYEYLRLFGVTGNATFGFDRWVNQQFYRSAEWRRTRTQIIARDEGLDLGFPGHEIFDKVFIHHMNPMVVNDIEQGDPAILDPEFLICVSHDTHNAIHYGDASLLKQPYVERRPGDTRSW